MTTDAGVRLASGARLVAFDVVDSTNAEARRFAERGEPMPVWLMAARQTAGRGRHGRNWVSDPGNLFVSLLLDCDAPPRTAGQVSFVAALAVVDTLHPLLPDATVQIKWPNDVLVDGRKIAGILLESHAAGAGQVRALIVGIGVNLASAPPDTAFPATCLAQIIGGAAPSPRALTDRLDGHFFARYGVWTRDGFDPVRDAWLAAAAGRGENITARTAQSTVTGRFETISSDGARVWRLPSC